MDEPNVPNENLDNSPPSWKETVEKDYRDVIDRFSEPKDLAKAYVDLYSDYSKKVKIPDENAPPEKINEFWSKVGKPEKPDQYEIKVPEDTKVDNNFIDKMKQLAFEANVPKGQFGKLAEGYLAYQKEAEAQQVKQITELNETRWEKYKNEWGPEVTAQNIELAKKAFDELAPDELKELMSRDDVENDPILVKMYSTIWRKTLDDTIVKGQGTKPPEQPKAPFEPEFHKKYGTKGQS